MNLSSRNKKVLDKAAENFLAHLDRNERPHILTMGGPSRSGKLTFVRCLFDRSELNNISVNVISMKRKGKGDPPIFTYGEIYLNAILNSIKQE